MYRIYPVNGFFLFILTLSCTKLFLEQYFIPRLRACSLVNVAAYSHELMHIDRFNRFGHTSFITQKKMLRCIQHHLLNLEFSNQPVAVSILIVNTKQCRFPKQRWQKFCEYRNYYFSSVGTQQTSVFHYQLSSR